MMMTSVGECLCASMCGDALQQTLFEWERPPAQTIHIIVNSGKGPNGNQIQGDFRNGDDDHADEGDDGDDDCHHDKNGDGVHPWYQLDYHLYFNPPDPIVFLISTEWAPSKPIMMKMVTLSIHGIRQEIALLASGSEDKVQAQRFS